MEIDVEDDEMSKQYMHYEQTIEEENSLINRSKQKRDRRTAGALYNSTQFASKAERSKFLAA